MSDPTPENNHPVRGCFILILVILIIFGAGILGFACTKDSGLDFVVTGIVAVIVGILVLIRIFSKH